MGISFIFVVAAHAFGTLDWPEFFFSPDWVPDSVVHDLSADLPVVVLARREVAHIQMPFNLLDWRWRKAGVIAEIEKRDGLTVHARSVFLQGLLAANDPAIWPRIEGVDPKSLIELLARLTAALEEL